ncbi:hypothetical protein NQ176_g4396 [Zarea fungicola]|uniref:Uncharacterized protein n=1 Tax=Zarea fungicola TaxID=93591 RepID=A0ACC1NG54_9HYPO|nr:hypothetical protein NQ176_g4396 [Lecanicillium fungicola]
MMQKTLPILALAATAMAGGATCPANSPLSCHNNGPVSDTCCFIPAGHLVQTQFWDSNPATGPSNSWTIHGLWPDNCDGSFPSQCDPDRAYTDIADILTATGKASRGLNKGHRYNKTRAGRRKTWKRHNTLSLWRYR